MPRLPRARRPKADGVEGTAEHRDTGTDKLGHRRPSTRKTKGPTSEHNHPKPPVPEADISTDAPIFKADNSTSPEPRFYLLDYTTKRVAEKYENPVRDEYDVDLKALGEQRKDAHSGHAGPMDRNYLEEAVKLKLQAGLEAVQPVIAKKFKKLEDLIAYEYYLADRAKMVKEWKKKMATIKRDNKRHRQGKRAKFTRAEVKEANDVWAAKRTSLGVRLDADLDYPGDPAPADTEEQKGKHIEGKSILCSDLFIRRLI